MGIFTVNLNHGFPAKNQGKLGKGDGNGLSPRVHLLVIRLNRSWVVNLLARILLVAMVIALFPWIGLRFGGFSADWTKYVNDAGSEAEIAYGSIYLPGLFHDLANEGLMKTGDRTLFVTAATDEAIHNSQILSSWDMDFISYTDLDKQSSIPDDTYNVVLANAFDPTDKFIDRTLKVDGIVVVSLGDNPSSAFRKPCDYKFVYHRRFGSTAFVAIRKAGISRQDSPAKRRLLGVSDKKEALNHLEDVLLEPPRKSYRRHLRSTTRYLPDLTGDTLESYPRRVFIDVAPAGSSSTEWFRKNYPMRNRKFEMYKVETVPEGEKVALEMTMSEWLRRNVREEEYVVMKAEAEEVEEMVKNRVIGLVDELFLECKHDQGRNGKSERSRRAYWECLALYGGLKDQGIAVHQWWD